MQSPMLVEINQQQLSGFETLLQQGGLPATDIASANWFSLVGWQDAGRLVGAGGIEQCGSQFLLRSVVVAESHWGRGIGKNIVMELQHRAMASDVGTLYLLTGTATGYFSGKLGWRVMERDDAPGDIASSNQFSILCPASATLMELSI
jgi:amino-acid N-acetyltransferase